MKYIKEYLELLDKSLIKKSYNATTIFNNFFYNSYLHRDKKLWKNLILYKEIISSLSIDEIYTNYTKVISWMDANEKNKLEDIWSIPKQAMYNFIAYIEGKNYMKLYKKIDSKLLFLIQEYTKNNDIGFRSEGLKETNILNAPKNLHEIKDYIWDLELFVNDKESDKNYTFLVKLALMHYQFEAIHPFNNSNGIIGRMINNLYLIKQTEIDSPKIAMSSFIYHHKQTYFNLFEKVEKDPKAINEFVNFIILSACESCIESENMIKDVDKLVLNNINKLIDVLNNDFDILNSQYIHFSNILLISKSHIKNFLNIDDEQKLEKWINILIDKKVLKYINKNNPNNLIFINVWEYLMKLDNQLIKKS